MSHEEKKPKLGSLFAGIGGFDLGFERAGFRSAWQVEQNPAWRALLAERFGGRQFDDVRTVGTSNLEAVDVITAGFPCQDASTMGSGRRGGRQGLRGSRTGLFFEVIRIARELLTPWLVLENVVGLLSVNDGADFQTCLEELAACGYDVAWRVLDSRYFGVPQSRRRVFMVCHLGQPPPLEFLVDAASLEPIPVTLGARELARAAMAHAANCLTASNSPSQINLGSETLIAEANGWCQMVERQRGVEIDGLSCGLDSPHFLARYGAGNAVCPACAQWIAEKIIAEITA